MWWPHYQTPWQLTHPAAPPVAVSWTRTVDPKVEPITIQEAQDQTRYTTDDNNASLMRYIASARDAAEETLSRGLLTQTWVLQRDYWADAIWLPMAAPLQIDTPPTVSYIDLNGAQQVLPTTGYIVDSISRPARLLRAAGTTWPSLQADRKAGIQITYVVGWKTANDVPDRIKQGIRQYLAYLDMDREGMDLQASAALEAAIRCWDDRVFWIET